MVAAVTVSLAVPVLPVPAVASLTVTLLFAAPACVPCTLMETVQLVPAARLAPLRETALEPVLPLAVPVQVLLTLLAPTSVPGALLGSVSVKEMLLRVSFILFELATVMVKLVVAPNAMLGWPKVLLMCGGLITVRLAGDVVLPLPAAVESMVTLFEYTLSTALDTLTVMVQVPTANEGLEKLILFAPAVAVTVPLQLLVTPGLEATTKLPGCGPTFCGRLSVKLASIGITFEFVMLKVIVLNAPVLKLVDWIVVGLKLLVIEGGSKMMMPDVTLPPPDAASAVVPGL